MDKPLDRVPDLGQVFWRDLGSYIIKQIRLMTARGEGVDGRFKPYSREYRQRKTTGEPFIPRQANYSGTPNLHLTGDMMGDLQQIAVSDQSVSIGWPAEGWKVEANAAMGRAISTKEQPVARDIAEEIEQRYKVAIDKRLEDARFNRVVTIGRK